MPETIAHLVSTIIPIYNRPAMLVEAVESVLTQTHRPIEIIISDDGSTDDTPQIASAMQRQYPQTIRVVMNVNRGPGPAREAGRRLAKGEFIQYLDSDDLLRPMKFELEIAALRANPQCGAAYGYICVHTRDGVAKQTPYEESGQARERLFPWILADRWWNTDCPLWRRDTCDRIGPWSDLRWSEDWEYDGRAGALDTRLAHVPQFGCDERQHTGQRQRSPADWMAADRLMARKRFLELLLGHAEKVGVAPTSPQRQRFTRWVFATARQCAAAGLVDTAKQCMVLAETSAGTCRDVRRGFGVFYAMCAVLGWERAGRSMLSLQSRWRPGRFIKQHSFAKEIM